MARLVYAKQVTPDNIYSNAASVYYDRPAAEPLNGTGNIFVIADYDNTIAIIQAVRSQGNDVVSFLFPTGQFSVTNMWKPSEIVTLDVTKYGVCGDCILIGDLLHVYLSVQTRVSSTKTKTNIWHFVVADILVR